MTTKIDNRIKSEENRQALLNALYKFGYLTVPQIANSVWFYSTQARTMALRLLKKLELENLIEAKTIATQVRIYSLTLAGFSAINKKPYELIIDSNYTHRALSNWWLIPQSWAGSEVISENDIQTGQGFKGVLGFSGKVPDGFYIQDGLATLVEIENASKNSEKQSKFIEIAQNLDEKVTYYLDDDTVLADIDFVCANFASAQSIIRTFRQAFEKGQISEIALTHIRVFELHLDKRLNVKYFAAYPVLAYVYYDEQLGTYEHLSTFHY